MIMRAIFLCVQLLFSVRRVLGYCADGSRGFTTAEYEAAYHSPYAKELVEDTTCIPNRRFYGYGGDVTFTGLQSLKSIEQGAFLLMRGRLIFTGEYPALVEIAPYAFYGVGNADSVVRIACSSPAGLTIVGSTAFAGFLGNRIRSYENKPCIVATTTATATTTTTTTSLCPDGSVGLTKALYEGGDVAAYRDVTCIPDGEFEDYTGDVTLNGLPSLKSVGCVAFRFFGGKLTFTGEYPALEIIGGGAFLRGLSVGNAASAITFNGLPSLKSIGERAFDKFDGKLTFTGSYPALEIILYGAFSEVRNANSVIAFTGLPSLEHILQEAFFRFSGKLTFTGEYPALRTIRDRAFTEAGNPVFHDSVVAIACSYPYRAFNKAFHLFQGTHKTTNEFMQCVVTTTTTISITTSTTATTTTSISTTTATTATTTTTIPTTTATTATTTTTISTTTTTTATATTTLLPVNAECNPRNDRCDSTQELWCRDTFPYKCQYRIPSTSASTTIATPPPTTTATSTTSPTVATSTTTNTRTAIVAPGARCTISSICTNAPCKNGRCCRSDVNLACTSCDDAGVCSSTDKMLTTGAGGDDNNEDEGGGNTLDIIGAILGVGVFLISATALMWKLRKSDDKVKTVMIFFGCSDADPQPHRGLPTTIPDRRYFNKCLKREAAAEFLNFLKVDAVYLSSIYDRCYCTNCYKGPAVIENQGPTPYVVPEPGWVRFGLDPGPRAYSKELDVFNTWCACFHGVKSQVVLSSILNCKGVMKPGDTLVDGMKLQSTKCAGRQDKVVYTSPTIKYAGLKFYAEPIKFITTAGVEMRGSVVLQCRQNPGTFETQGETMGFEKFWPGHLAKHCPNVDLAQIEWKTEVNNAVIPYGLLVRIWPKGYDPNTEAYSSPVDRNRWWADEQVTRRKSSETPC